MGALRPISDNLREITNMMPPQIEEIYEKLLWIRGDVKDMALDKTWVEPLPGAIPDTNKVTTNPLGVEEDTYYLITASSTETTLG